MKYLISEEELKKLILAVSDDNDGSGELSTSDKFFIDNYLKTKHPVDSELLDLFMVMFEKFKEINRFKPKYLKED